MKIIDVFINKDNDNKLFLNKSTIMIIKTFPGLLFSTINGKITI